MRSLRLLSLVLVLVMASTANGAVSLLTDFLTGTIDGPFPTMVVGDTANSLNNMAGGAFDTFGSGSWTGNDDIWQLNWTGGAMTANLFFQHSVGDLDLWLHDNAEGMNALDFGESFSDNETVGPMVLAPGTYYLRVDGYSGDNNAYDLEVTPEPATMSLLAFGGLALIRRRK